MIKRISNKSSVLEKQRQAFKSSTELLYKELQKTLSTPQYWAGFENRLTVRQNGEIVKGAFRNIVDTRALIDSQKIELSENKATISWDGNNQTPAASVFFGERTPTSYIPGRNWVNATLANLNLSQSVKDNF